MIVVLEKVHRMGFVNGAISWKLLEVIHINGVVGTGVERDHGGAFSDFRVSRVLPFHYFIPTNRCIGRRVYPS